MPHIKKKLNNGTLKRKRNIILLLVLKHWGLCEFKMTLSPQIWYSIQHYIVSKILGYVLQS